MWGFLFAIAARRAYDGGVITVLIETKNDEVALAHALAALVPAATEGVVREVIVIDRGSDDGTLVVAEAAGCTVVPARSGDGEARRSAAERARGDWLLFLPPTTVVQPGWQSAAMTWIDRVMVAGSAASAVGYFRRGRLDTGWWAKVAAGLRRLVGKGAGEGVLVSKAAWLALNASSPASSASFASGARRGAA